MIGREFNLDGGPAAIAYFSVMKTASDLFNRIGRLLPVAAMDVGLFSPSTCW